MKALVAAGILSVISLYSASASACTPAPELVYQTTMISHVVESEAYRTTINERLEASPRVRIEDFIANTNELTIRFSDRCIARFKAVYARPNFPGMCPLFMRVEVTTECPE